MQILLYMIELNNEFLQIKIAKKGAEITSIYDKRDGTEHMWQADQAVWPWHGPNLFPIVGGCKDDRILIDGQYFHLPRHGFARHSTFTILEASDSHAVLSLTFSDESLRNYPYRFELQVLYDLEENHLRVTYKVINLDKKSIYFSVGAHPAFAVPFFQNERYSDYYLEFEHEEEFRSHQLDSQGLFNGETVAIAVRGRQLPISGSLFARDALVFMDIKSKSLSIKSKNHQKSISVHFPMFRELGIWAKPDAPFVCIEPWLGHADHASPNAIPFREKPGIQSLGQGHIFEADFTIGINL